VNDEGYQIQSYEDLRTKWSEVYIDETVEDILSKHVLPYPERSSNYMLYEDKLYIISGGRGASWGFNNFWERASVELIEQNDDGSRRVYQFILPHGQQEERVTEDASGAEVYDLYYSSYGQHEIKVEIEKIDDQWKLITFIDTLGM
jgi:hypothetical protein